jgi:mannonate dehydratase
VTIAVHPDDPPVPELGGIARIFRSVGALRRAADFWPGPGFGIELCLGTISEMGGQEAVLDAISYLAPRGKIAYVHLRDVRGTVPAFTECFLGEGNYDPATVLRALSSGGFRGFILDDHTPALVGDSPYGHRGRAFALGYIQGLIEMMNHDDPLLRDIR